MNILNIIIQNYFFELHDVDWPIELLASFIGPIATGISAVLLYWWKIKCDKKRSTYHSASILLNEILDIIESKRYAGMLDYLTRGGIPSDDVYRGLLLTGNIRYFENKTQRQLSDFYGLVKLNRMDKDLAINILEGVSILKTNNK